jgi:hypothetical protein
LEAWVYIVIVFSVVAIAVLSLLIRWCRTRSSVAHIVVASNSYQPPQPTTTVSTTTYSNNQAYSSPAPVYDQGYINTNPIPVQSGYGNAYPINQNNNQNNAQYTNHYNQNNNAGYGY